MSTDRAALLTREILEALFSDHTDTLRARLWDGTFWPDDSMRPVTLVLKHPGALRAMLIPGDEVSLAEAYLYGDYDIEGEIQRVFAVADGLLEGPDWRTKVGLATRLLRLPSCTHP